MSLEGTEGALDAVPEVQEIDEIPNSEPITQLPGGIPEVPNEGFDASIETIRNTEGAEKIVDNEVSKAEAVIDLTDGALGTAKEATGNPDLFAEEESELKALNSEALFVKE